MRVHTHTISTAVLRSISQRFCNCSPCFQGHALVGSPLSLARVQAEGCALYRSCEVCARARGLGCVWSTKEEACKQTTEEWVLQEYHNELEIFQKNGNERQAAAVWGYKIPQWPIFIPAILSCTNVFLRKKKWKCNTENWAICKKRL